MSTTHVCLIKASEESQPRIIAICNNHFEACVIFGNKGKQLLDEGFVLKSFDGVCAEFEPELALFMCQGFASDIKQS